MGIVTLIAEDLVKIKPTDPLIFGNVQLVRSETTQIPQVILQVKY